MTGSVVSEMLIVMNSSFSIRAIISSSWALFRQRPWFFIGLQVIPFLVLWVLDVVASLLLNPLSNVIDQNPDSVALVLAVGGISILYQFVSWVFMMFMYAGTTYAQIKSVDGERPPLAVIFQQKRVVIPYILVLVLIGFVSIFGFVLFIIPGIIWTLVTLFAAYLVVDKHTGVIESIKQSMALTKGVRFKLLLFLLTISSLNILGALLLIVGLIVTIPLTSLAMAKAYVVLRDRNTAIV